MSGNRLPDYLDHIQQAAADARSFVEGLGKDDFLTDKRTQQAVIMNTQWSQTWSNVSSVVPSK